MTHLRINLKIISVNLGPGKKLTRLYASL